MDDFGVNRAIGSIRYKALTKFAHYAAEGSNDFNDLSKLSAAVRKKDGSTLPIYGKEFEVLLSLASSAAFVPSEMHADMLNDQLGAYLVESPSQKLAPSPTIRRMSDSPWETSTKLLASSVLAIGSSFPASAERSKDYIARYLARVQELWADGAIVDNRTEFFPLIFSVLGFLEALASRAAEVASDAEFLLSVIQKLGEVVTSDFLLKVEGAISYMRSDEVVSQVNSLDDFWLAHDIALLNRDHSKYSAMLFSFHLCEVYRNVAKTFIDVLGGKETHTKSDSLIEMLNHARPPLDRDDRTRSQILDHLNEFALSQVESLDEGADYIELASPQKIALALAIKSSLLEIVAVTTYYDVLSPAAVIDLIDSSIGNSTAMGNSKLALSVFQISSFLSARDDTIGSTMAKYMPSFLLNPRVHPEMVADCSKALAEGLKMRSQDIIVSLIYTLINMLVADTDSGAVPANGGGKADVLSSTASRTEDVVVDQGSIHEGRLLQIYQNVVTAIVSLTINYDVDEITSLSATILAQKLNNVSRVLDYEVLMGLAQIAPHLNEREFKLVLRAYSSLDAVANKSNEPELIFTVLQARNKMSHALKRGHRLYDVYLTELLTNIVSKGDVQELEHHRSHHEISAAADEIVNLLPPLAELLPKVNEKPYETTDQQISALFRNAWFNMVVHGFAKNSKWTTEHKDSLEIIAQNTPPLVSEVSTNKIESELELNTVLRRGSSNSNVSNQKEIMSAIFSMHNFEFRSLSYPRLMFLSATVLLESLRANTGNCSKVLLYFGDPGFRSGDTGKYMSMIATDTIKAYINNVIQGREDAFSADNVARQLREILILCCHRVSAIQNIAFTCADLLIKAIPSSLCKQDSLFTLLDLLSLLWTSCLDAETDEYEPRAIFVSPKTNIRLELSDSYDHRRDSLKRLLDRARFWVRSVLDVMGFDLKSLLTSYLAGMIEFRFLDHVALGCTFALEMGGTISKTDGALATIAHSQSILTDSSSGFLSQYVWRTEFEADERMREENDSEGKNAIKAKLEEVLRQENRVPFEEVRDLLFEASCWLSDERQSRYIARLAVMIPFKIFTAKSVQLGVSLWLWAMNEAPRLKYALLSQVAIEWEKTITSRLGLFSDKYNLSEPEFGSMEYAPSNKADVDHYTNNATRSFAAHLTLIRFMASVFQATNYESKHLLKMFTRAAVSGLKGLKSASLSPLSRSPRFELLRFALDILDAHSRLSSKICDRLKDLIFTSALSWFKQPALWPYGGNRLKLRSDVSMLKDIAQKLSNVSVSTSKYNTREMLSEKRELLLMFMNDELSKMSTWLDPLQVGPSYREFGKKLVSSSTVTPRQIETAWSINPTLAVFLTERYNNSDTVGALEALIAKNPAPVVRVPEALKYFLQTDSSSARRFLLFWVPVNPIESINLFMPRYGSNSLILQYAMRSLESHDVNLTFFYVPQIVQCLRYDRMGYVERYILETAKLSTLFAHQIIWNILANSYKDEDSTVPDPMKPALDQVIDKMTASFNEEERSFYDREFGFFNEVTSISGKLKPYIKKTKAEKKDKIDEEIDKINVAVGVYLPSNPDGSVVDIDRKSGKPLQSHAKAPFLATFKIRRKAARYEGSEESADQLVPFESSNSSDNGEDGEYEDVWQSAIFKVGDDCRQDMLALQIIAVFRSIFKNSGMDLFVYPYRVTATAPGCGVIDVLPNSISRDMLGREAVNGLYEYFTTKHGGEDSIEFQQARNNFVKSLAAYSVISYLIQFKDRHNGNIMYDNDGHIIHIDFGFCFDIVPGGVKFEAAPFKLTHEMVAVMGGSTHTQAYQWFEELCVKAYVACRPHCETIVQMVMPMLGSGLPCFKGEQTIKRLRARFVLEKSEREAAQYFRGLIKKSIESLYTKGYDEFQRLTNGIPY
ncbi:phosphatidylinositol 4-kinase Stt4p [Trichomonascus vanleenenianus]|uniref:1-phosphatidylinositol 4-kinase STT4 n=1 Tax=Trichomonascus vanleenenianus TaxID=2268995 RepID=UPI003ECA5B32